MTDLTFDLERVGAISVMWLDGDLDIDTAPDVILLANAAVARPELRELVIDMGPVRFMDSAGTGALVRARNLCRNHGVRLRLRAVGPRVRKVLEVSGLATAFEMD